MLKISAAVYQKELLEIFRDRRTMISMVAVPLIAIPLMFNLINRFNVADVNPLYTQAGTPTAAFDPRQFQFGLRISF